MLLALISVILMIVLFDPQQDASRVYYGTDTRAFSLLFGALLAILWEYQMVPRRLSASVNMVLGSVSFAVLLVMTIAINGSSNFWYRGGQFVGTILTVLVIYTVSGRKTWLSRFLSNPVLKWIGDRSYSIYLWHYPIILLISKGIKASWWITLIEIVLSVVLAELSYRFIETPIRHGIIGEYLNILRSRPKSRQEKKRQVQVARRSLKVMAGTFVLTVSLILCMIFVPKKNALDTLQKRESKAKETGKMTEEQLAKQKANGSESEDTICTTDLTDDEILEGLNLLLIGDSIAVDVTDDFYEMFPNSVSDTKIGRITSLGKQVLDSYIDEKKWEGEGVIFASLSNSPINGELEAIREKIGKDMPLFLTTVRIPHDTFEEESNSKIKKFVEENDHTYLIDWYAASDGTKFYERIDAHALDDADMSDVIMQYDHEGRVFARESNNTLILIPDHKGLLIAADLGKTDLARGLYQDIEAGMITKMSWAFTVSEESYDRATRTRTILKIKKVYDVSAVSIPANGDTEIAARNFASRSYEAEKQERLKRRIAILKMQASL